MSRHADDQKPTYFTSESALSRRFKRDARASAFTGSRAVDAKRWQARARKTLASLLGLDRFERCPAAPKLISRTPLDGIVREEWRIQTERDVWTPFYLFVPAVAGEPRPLVICPHGHASSGKNATGGRSDVPGMAPVIQEYNYDYGVQLARAGFITACPDARGFNERAEPALQNEAQRFGSSCHHLTLAGAPLGMTVQGMWTWDLMRLIDHLQHDKRVDPTRIGCAGLSGGGLQTLNLAALDTRVASAVVSGYFYGVREALQINNSNCMCNMVPNLWRHFDMGDIGAMIAPRGLMIETGDKDPLNGLSMANVTNQVSIARRVYKALGAEKSALQHHVFAGGHRWDGTRAIPWLQARLGVSAAAHAPTVA
jgi:dienelactone hydrolase